jgi:hypothetical protein
MWMASPRCFPIEAGPFMPFLVDTMHLLFRARDFFANIILFNTMLSHSHNTCLLGWRIKYAHDEIEGYHSVNL